MDTYSYRTTAVWTTERRGIVEAEQVPTVLDFASPPEFKGPGGLWTPEHLLVAAVATCFTTTFRAIAEASHFEPLSLEITVEGRLEHVEGGYRFTEFILRPAVTVSEVEQRDRAIRLMEKAERACLITHSLSARTVLEAEVHIFEDVTAV